MTHYGDITKLNGAELPAVDVITGGSPCQDLSIAGKRAGLVGERSGLFMEQIRVIKEMRQHDRDSGRTGKLVRPRYMVWENVPGAFSSNGGEDFRAVLEETAHIADESAVIPQPPKGKWTTSGAIVGDGWSIAWRVLDAQFWGVPQRRRRIALVADFGGQSAHEILFERKGVPGNIAESGTAWEGIAGDAERGFGETGVGYWQSGIQCLRAEGENRPSRPSNVICVPDIARSLTARNDGSPCVDSGPEIVMQPVAGFSYKASPGAGSIGYAEEQAPTILGERQDASIFDARGNGDGSTAPTMTGDHNGRILDFTVRCFRNGQANQGVSTTSDMRDTVGTLKARDYKGCEYLTETLSKTCFNGSSVRRLTPMECERLQGYPQKEKLDLSKMTKDEYIAWNIVAGNIVVDADKGKVFATRGPGGIVLEKPREMSGSDNNGYLVVSIRNGTTKMSCRVHRIIWISQNGVIPEGFVVDHINSNKKDNRICNLQLLTTAENSLKAKEDGLYCSGEDNKATKLSPDLWDEIAYLYEFSDMTIRELADTYGVSKSRISQIIRLDGWTDIGDWTDSKGKVHKPSDSARYKALGNSIALPPWRWILLRITAQYERTATLGSLFDGIGGFPLIWERLNGAGTCIWASEIEEFCIAVTEKRFGAGMSERSGA